MEDRPPRRARLFEFASAVATIGLVSLILLDRLSVLQEEAERLAVESTVHNMNSGLVLRQAELVTSGREHELPALVGRNPVDWLEAPPPGYIGTAACAAPGTLDEGQWCWDAVAAQVVYRPRHVAGLKIDDDLPLLRWRVQAPADPRAVRPGAVRVASVVRYVWRP